MSLCRAAVLEPAAETARPAAALLVDGGAESGCA